MRRALPIAIAIFLAGGVSFALSRLDRAPTAPTRSVSTTIADAGPPSELAEIDQRIAFFRQRADADPRAWLDREQLATSWMSRAQLTGDYADWQRAEQALDESFVSTGGSWGPNITRAAFDATMHRYDRVDADLDAAEHVAVMRVHDREAIDGLRADARYYTGRYAEARALYEQRLVQTHRAIEPLVLLAQLDWHTGHFDDAAALLDEALVARGAGRGVVRAWALTTRASMERDRGRFDDALAAIEAARALVPEDAHRDELLAEIDEARGDDDEALRLFRELASGTSSPQAIDGVARILRRRGDTVAANELIALARQTYETQISYYPEAAYGHAIDHWLRLEPDDVDRMITIAEGNAQARPYGETRIKLAIAYLLAGHVADARTTLDAVLATEWSTADLHAVNAITLAREGADDAAERSVAEAIAPGVMDRYAWLDDAR